MGCGPAVSITNTVGEQVAARGQTDDGAPLDLVSASRPVVLFFTMRGSGRCMGMYPRVAALRAAYPVARARFVLVDVFDTRPMERPAALGPDVDLLTDPGTWARHFDVRQVPRVIIVGSGGTVLFDEALYSDPAYFDRVAAVLSVVTR